MQLNSHICTMTHTSTESANVYKIKISYQIKEALQFVGSPSEDSDVQLVIESERELHALSKLILIKHYRDVVASDIATVNEDNIAELIQWYSGTETANEHVNAMAAMLSHGRRHFEKMLAGDVLEHEFDIENMVKCYELTGLDEADSRQLVSELAYFVNKFTEQVNPIFTPQFRFQIFEDLMDDFAEGMAEFQQAGKIGKFALAKEIMGLYMERTTRTVEDSLLVLNLSSVNDESL